MYTLYRGDPQRGGTLVGFFDDPISAAQAIDEDAKNHEGGLNYYMVGDQDNEPDRNDP